MAIIWNMSHTTYFEYKAGTKLIYFIFPEFYHGMVRDGVPIFLETEGPLWMEKQPPISDPHIQARVREKIEKVIDQRYLFLSRMHPKSYIHYFGIPKGDDNIQIVYDGTASGLNDAMWAP